MIPARRPDSGIGGSENRQRRGADSGREMRDAAVIADEEAGAREEAGDLVQIVDADRAGQRRVVFARTPSDRHRQLGGESAKLLQRPVLPGAPGKWMNNRPLLLLHSA